MRHANREESPQDNNASDELYAPTSGHSQSTTETTLNFAVAEIQQNNILQTDERNQLSEATTEIQLRSVNTTKIRVRVIG